MMKFLMISPFVALLLAGPQLLALPQSSHPDSAGASNVTTGFLAGVEDLSSARSWYEITTSADHEDSIDIIVMVENQDGSKQQSVLLASCEEEPLLQNLDLAWNGDAQQEESYVCKNLSEGAFSHVLLELKSYMVLIPTLNVSGASDGLLQGSAARVPRMQNDKMSKRAESYLSLEIKAFKSLDELNKGKNHFNMRSVFHQG